MSKSLQEQLRQLKRQRATELKNAGYLFARAKRDTRRVLSPDRMIRKHLGASLAVAFVGAMLLAPAPSKAKGKKSTWTTLLKALDKVVPQLKQYIPGLSSMMASATAEPEPEHIPPQPIQAPTEPRKQRRRSMLATVLTEVLGLALARIPWQQILQSFLMRMSPQAASAAPATDYPPGRPYAEETYPGPGAPPSVSVDDAGTRRADKPIDDV